MNLDSSMLGLSGHFGTPSRRTVALHVCSTPIATGNNGSNPSDGSSENVPTLLDSLDEFLEQYGTFFKSTSSSSSEQSVDLVAADGRDNDLLDLLDFPGAADEDGAKTPAPLNGILSPITSHHEVPEVFRTPQPSLPVANRGSDNAHAPYISLLDAPQVFDDPPQSPRRESNNEDPLLDSNVPLGIPTSPRVTQLRKNMPLYRFANDERSFLLNDSPSSPRGESSSDDPLLHRPPPVIIPTALEVTKAYLSSQFGFLDEASDNSCFVSSFPPRVIPHSLESSQNKQASPDCSEDTSKESVVAPHFETRQIDENHLHLPTVHSRDHGGGSLQDGPHFPVASFVDVPQACKDNDNCQDAPSKTQILRDFAADVPDVSGTASNFAELSDVPVSIGKNDSAANVPTTPHLSFRHSPVFFTGILGSGKEESMPIDAACIDTDSSCSTLVLGELSQPVAQYAEVEPSPIKENDDMQPPVTDELHDTGCQTPATASEVKEKESPACSVNSTDTLVLDVDNEDLAIVTEQPEQDETLVTSSHLTEETELQERASIAIAFHHTSNSLDTMKPDSTSYPDLRQRINNIRNNASVKVAACSSRISKGECSNISNVAEAQFSKHGAKSSFIIQHLHDSTPCSSGAVNLLRRLEPEQTSQGPQTVADATSRREPFMSLDPKENDDNANPLWETMRQLTTDEERYEAVRNVWHNLIVPNPHRDLSNFICRRQRLGAQPVTNTPVPKQRKRKASHDPGSHRPAKRQRMDTDIFDMKLKALEKKRSHDIYRAQQHLEWHLVQLRSSIDENQWQSSFHQGSWPSHRNHQRAHTAPWDFRYYRQEEQRLHAQFMGEQDTIHHRYSAKENKLLSARKEVRHFDRFYVGLQEANPTQLTEEQLKDQLNKEKLLGLYRLYYSGAKN